jgi:hypothetical protein
MDGPFAETKEQLLGFWINDCASLEDAIHTAATGNAASVARVTLTGVSPLLRCTDRASLPN